MNEQHEISSPLLKIASAWALIGITSWADFAAFLGAIYTSLLMAEWLWKKVIRPFCISMGWIKASGATDADPAA